MYDPADIAIEDLPATLREMAALVGLPATLTLMRNFGGVRITIPEHMKPEHLLARMIGFEAACRLSQHYRGADGVDMPRGLEAIIAVRNREIRRQAAMGKTHRQLALEHRLTERHVRNILSAEPSAEQQARLF